MKLVGIRELKNQLSRYLKLVKNGEVVIITDRKKVIAEIRKPMPSESHLNTNFVTYLNQQEKEGKIIRASRTESIIDSIIKKKTRDKISIEWKDIYKSTRQDRQ